MKKKTRNILFGVAFAAEAAGLTSLCSNTKTYKTEVDRRTDLLGQGAAVVVRASRESPTADCQSRGFSLETCKTAWRSATDLNGGDINAGLKGKSDGVTFLPSQPSVALVTRTYGIEGRPAPSGRVLLPFGQDIAGPQ